MSPSLSKSARATRTKPEKPQRAQNLLADTYLNLLKDQNRRLAAEERAIEEERLHLAELPELIADLQSRLSEELPSELQDILQAKLEEAHTDFAQMQRRMVEREAAWPARKAEMVAEIAQFHEKLGQSSV